MPSNVCVPYSSNKTTAPSGASCSGVTTGCGGQVGGQSGYCQFGTAGELPVPGYDTSPPTTSLKSNPASACPQPQLPPH